MAIYMLGVFTKHPPEKLESLVMGGEEELLRHDVMRHHEASCTRLRQVRFAERQDERTAATARSRGSTEYQYCK